MKVVVDANVVIKWFIGEEDSLTARSLLGRDQDLVAPEHVLAEVGQALWRHFREGEVTRVQIRDALMRLPNFVELVPLEEVAVEAADMACEIALRSTTVSMWRPQCATIPIW